MSGASRAVTVAAPPHWRPKIDLSHNQNMIAPPNSLDPAGSLPRQPAFLTLRLVGRHGLVQPKIVFKLAAGDFDDDRLLLVIPPDRRIALARLRGRMREGSHVSGLVLQSMLLTGDHVLRETLGITAPVLELPAEWASFPGKSPSMSRPLGLMDVAGINPRPIDWPAELSTAQFVVVHLPTRRKALGIRLVDAGSVDDIPRVGRSLAVVDNHGDRSMVQYHGKLRRVPRDHAKWVCMTLYSHFYRLRRMASFVTRKPHASRADGIPPDPDEGPGRGPTM